MKTRIISDFNLVVKSQLNARERRRLLRAMDREFTSPDGSRVTFGKLGTGYYPVGIDCEDTSWYEPLYEEDSSTFYNELSRRRAAAARAAVRSLMTRIGRTFEYTL